MSDSTAKGQTIWAQNEHAAHRERQRLSWGSFVAFIDSMNMTFSNRYFCHVYALFQ